MKLVENGLDRVVRMVVNVRWVSVRDVGTNCVRSADLEEGKTLVAPRAAEVDIAVRNILQVAWNAERQVLRGSNCLTCPRKTPGS